MYLNIYVPKLQHEQGIVWFFREHRGLPVPSAAVMSPMRMHLCRETPNSLVAKVGR